MSTVDDVKPRRHPDESSSSRVHSVTGCMQSPRPHHRATSVNIQPQHITLCITSIMCASLTAAYY